jgi:hypothetical protein
MPRARSFDGFVRRNSLRLVSLGMLVVAGEYAASVQRAHASVHGNWDLIVGIGLAAALVPIAFIAGSFWWSLRHPQALRLGIVAFLLTLAMVVGAFAGLVYTAPTVIPKSGAPETVTTPFQLAAITFMIPALAGLAAAGGLEPVLVARWRRRISGSSKLTGVA